MKTTIDIDEARLKRVMKLAGLKTRKAAVEFALREAERAARIKRLLGASLADEEFTDAVDSAYDVRSLRERERPGKT